jgi:hypothetical protein
MWQNCSIVSKVNLHHDDRRFIITNSSSIVKHIQQQCQKDQSLAFAYFFFDSRDSQKALQLHESLIRSLIQQFSVQYKTVPDALDKLYGNGHHQPSLDTLHATLQLILDGFQHVYITIDALDECVERGALLSWIREIGQWKMGKLHLLTTSRRERDITQGLESLDPTHVFMEGKSIDDDIQAYLEWRLCTDDKLVRWENTKIQGKIKAKLMEGAHGMYVSLYCSFEMKALHIDDRFRWVALQLDDLQSCLNARAVEQQLKSLPKNLDETYDRLLSKITKDYCGDAHKFLTMACLLCSSIDDP